MVELKGVITVGWMAGYLVYFSVAEMVASMAPTMVWQTAAAMGYY